MNCARCDRPLRATDLDTWVSVREYTDADTLYLCPACVTPAEHVEAEMSAAVLDAAEDTPVGPFVSVDPNGRLVLPLRRDDDGSAR